MFFSDRLNLDKFYLFSTDAHHVFTHAHEFLELAYVSKGSARHIRDGNEQIIREGDYFVIDYGSTHSYHALSDEFEIINCLFLPELIDVSLKHCKSLQTVIDNYQIQFRSEYFSVSPSSNTFKDDDGCIIKLLRDMLSEFQSGLPGYGQLIRARMIEILILTMRKIYINPTAGSHDDTMNAVISYIGKNYASDLTLGDICKKFGYSLPYMSLKFKQNFKMTYTAFLQKVRVEQAMRLLAHTSDSVEEVASSVGYGDLKAFYAVFKRFSGTTPISFRKGIRERTDI